MSTVKYPISALPLPPKSHVLTHNLTPDPITPSAAELRNVLTKNPSVQRRARLVHPLAHFSHLTPLPLPFPYRIEPPENEEIVDKAEYVERWLSSFEPLEERSSAPSGVASSLKKYSSGKRELKRELIGLSDTALRDCLPHLDIGDAFTHIGKPSLTTPDGELNGSALINGYSGSTTAQDLVDVLSGHSVLLSKGEDERLAYAPWSLRYSGHQFGVWAGQLGDGRAISICEPYIPFC